LRAALQAAQNFCSAAIGNGSLVSKKVNRRSARMNADVINLSPNFASFVPHRRSSALIGGHFSVVLLSTTIYRLGGAHSLRNREKIFFGT
jgi:hypothetical protein